MPFSTTNLEETFRKIQNTRMKGVPVINKHLNVKTVDFQEWNNYHLGILITPWFMNLMLFQKSGDANTTSLKTGSVTQHTFPSGSYEFVSGFEEEIGHYQSCSLFSPMLEFENQEAAEIVASEALKAIMDEENIDTSSQNPADEIEQIWKGEKPQPKITHNFDGSEIPNASKEEISKPGSTISERLAEPTSRRDFLRGKAFKKESLNNNNLSEHKS
ncbi:hypothetical protein GCM10009133_37710 [Cocleimonas flava]|uniref:[NiFe] hydrogenase assembly HybE family chaperone n=1 Tax=Cocleimonas flava TaxID=634765 RepID=A0A4R1FC94_9GAMM|nr:[NiFe]-hydrogenase assembly chaperone HybE [Cocleimonas flava]TCJ88391.1 [NiFe] hydrogenase assembly HybE family chaperone [Cocleimonas flava]